ncbi:MAG: amino acid ABC transporter substrate-binding protein [Armatimonadota bacterium]|nr:amino acid ABC transporter substrate-binding protein [Armatimonadota bacterium]
MRRLRGGGGILRVRERVGWGIGVFVLLFVVGSARVGSGAPSARPILVGGTLGLTGPFSGPSAVYKAVYEYWVSRVNREGGLLGRPVRLVLYDDEGKPAVAQALYQRLLKEDNVDLVLAPYTTLVGGSIIPIVESAGKVLWNGGFVGIELFKKSRWMVGAYAYQEPDYPRGIFELVDSLPPQQRPRRIGVVTEQNPFTLVVKNGYQGYGGVLGFARQRNIPVVLNEEFAPTVTDVRGLIQRAKAANVDLFFALALPNPAALLARTAHELGFKPAIYCQCGSPVTMLPYWRDLGPAAEGIMGTTIAWHTDRYKEVNTLHALLQRMGYPELPSYATVALTILQVMEQAVKATGTLDQAKLRAYVVGRKFATANGVLQYDKDGIPSYNQVILQFLRGRNEVVWPPNRATAKPIIPMP